MTVGIEENNNGELKRIKTKQLFVLMRFFSKSTAGLKKIKNVFDRIVTEQLSLIQKSFMKEIFLMGHTLVALFDTEGERRISSLVETVGQKQLPNKIPYGRDCDREKANERLPYHMTVFHWGKAMDAVYLDRLQSFQFTPCSIKVTGVSCMYAEEGSMLLYLNVEPDQGYMRLKEELECVLRSYTSGFLHITLAVSKEHDQILELKNCIEKQTGFPFILNVSSLGLYHIWKPVDLVKDYRTI